MLELPRPSDAVPVYATNLPIDRPEMIDAMAAKGHTRFKVKLPADAEAGARHLPAARAAAGDRPLMMDASQGQTPESLMAIMDVLEDTRLDWLEEPFPVDDIDSYKAWHATFARPPLAMGENSYGETGFRTLLDVIDPEWAQPDITKTAGITMGGRLCAMARQPARTWRCTCMAARSGSMPARSWPRHETMSTWSRWTPSPIPSSPISTGHRRSSTGGCSCPMGPVSASPSIRQCSPRSTSPRAEQMRIAIYGAGAVGGFLAAKLARAGRDVALIARGDHLAAIQADGLTLETPDQRFTVAVQASDDPATIGPVDLVLVTVKTTANQAVADGIAPLLGPTTPVVFAQNGVLWWYGQGFQPPVPADTTAARPGWQAGRRHRA